EQSLRQEVKPFLDKLAQNEETTRQAQHNIKRIIQNYPKLKSRLRKALEVGGQEVLKEIFYHPVIKIPTKMIEAWINED
ncbi:MAG: flotillin family protein, partial [Okeania sp. SIO2C9]|nr:flotillin family protein [Okeania sp. SIO2C9]